MKLQERLNALKKNIERKIPARALDIMHRATMDLKESGISEQAVQVGDKAPDFTLKNVKGHDISLRQLLTRGPVVLGFYRGRW